MMKILLLLLLLLLLLSPLSSSLSVDFLLFDNVTTPFKSLLFHASSLYFSKFLLFCLICSNSLSLSLRASCSHGFSTSSSTCPQLTPCGLPNDPCFRPWPTTSQTPQLSSNKASACSVATGSLHMKTGNWCFCLTRMCLWPMRYLQTASMRGLRIPT